MFSTWSLGAWRLIFSRRRGRQCRCRGPQRRRFLYGRLRARIRLGIDGRPEKRPWSRDRIEPFSLPFFGLEFVFYLNLIFFFWKLAIWGFEKKSLQVVSKASWRASQPRTDAKETRLDTTQFSTLLHNDVVLSNISFLFLILSPRVNYYLLFIIFPLPPSLLSCLRAKFDLQDWSLNY